MESRDDEPPVIRFSVGAEPQPRRGGPRTSPTVPAPPGPAPAPSQPKFLAPVPPWAVVMIAALAFGLGIVLTKATSHATGTQATAQAGDRADASMTRLPAAAIPATETIPTQDPQVQEPPAPAVAKTVVLNVRGNGIKDTKSFTTGPDWSVSYTFDCAGFGSRGNFAISEDSGDVLANALAANGNDTTYKHGDPGQHSLSVNSECDWTLKVTDGDEG